jgi:hypothetical protein
VLGEASCERITKALLQGGMPMLFVPEALRVVQQEVFRYVTTQRPRPPAQPWDPRARGNITSKSVRRDLLALRSRVSYSLVLDGLVRLK